MAGVNIHYNIQWTSLYKVLEEYGKYFIDLARADLGRNRSYASGKLGDEMKTDVQIYDDHFEVNIILQNYWKYVEKGRRPGKFPPPNVLEDWIRIKPVNKYPSTNGKIPTDQQLAFLIGRKIATKGIAPKPFFEKNKKPTYDHFVTAIALAIDEDVARWVESEVMQKAIYQELYRIF